MTNHRDRDREQYQTDLAKVAGEQINWQFIAEELEWYQENKQASTTSEREGDTFIRVSGNLGTLEVPAEGPIDDLYWIPTQGHGEIHFNLARGDKGEGGDQLEALGGSKASPRDAIADVVAIAREIVEMRYQSWPDPPAGEKEAIQHRKARIGRLDFQAGQTEVEG